MRKHRCVLVSCKAVCREAFAEESRTANICTDEQKLHKRHDQVGEVATLTEALQVQLLDHVDVAGIGRRISTLPGEIS